MKRASSEPRPGSTAWTRPPPRPARRRGPGSRSAASGRTDSQSPSSVTGPNAASGRPAARRPGRSRGAARRRRRRPRRATRTAIDPAVVEDDDAIADLLDLGQQVGVEDDRRAAIAARRARSPARRSDRPDRAPTSARRGGPASGVAEQRDTEPEPLLHALRERADRVVGAVGQPDQRERVVDGCRRARRRGIAGQLGVKAEHLAGMEPRLVAEQLGQVADPAPAPARSPSGAPRTWPEPALGRTRPSSSLMVVVLPAPFGPSSPTSSPRPTVRLRSVEGGRPPVRLGDPHEVDRGR